MDAQRDEERPDILAAFELQVARRADEIARERITTTSLNLDCWLAAETELLHQSPLFQAGSKPAAEQSC